MKQNNLLFIKTLFGFIVFIPMNESKRVTLKMDAE